RRGDAAAELEELGLVDGRDHALVAGGRVAGLEADLVARLLGRAVAAGAPPGAAPRALGLALRLRRLGGEVADLARRIGVFEGLEFLELAQRLGRGRRRVVRARLRRGEGDA